MVAENIVNPLKSHTYSKKLSNDEIAGNKTCSGARKHQTMLLDFVR